MRIILLVVVILIAESFGGDEKKKSVHFKIHVPEIVKHHIHTKTVFIHVHEMKPHKDEKEEHHVEDWTSYNSYNYKDGVEENHGGGYHRKKQKKVIAPHDDYMPIREDDHQAYGGPYSNELPDNLLANGPPPPEDNPLGYFGPPIDPEELMDPRVPPSSKYEIHEDVEEENPNDVEHVYHEEGYRRGMNSETGHVVHKDLKDFYDKEHHHGDFSKGGYEDDSYNKYNKHGYQGNYDKEMNAEQRSGKKKRADRRYFVTRMVIR